MPSPKPLPGRLPAEFGDHAYSLNGESLSEVLVRTLREKRTPCHRRGKLHRRYGHRCHHLGCRGVGGV